MRSSLVPFRAGVLVCAALFLTACGTGGFGWRTELAYVVSHPIVSPRVPFYRLDDRRRVDVEFRNPGLPQARYWFVDEARGITTPMTTQPVSQCPFAPFQSPDDMFRPYSAQGRSYPRHYAADDAQLIVFADGEPSRDANGGANLHLMVSADGGRSFTSRWLTLSQPGPWLPEQGRYAMPEPPVWATGGVVWFLVVRQGVAYLGMNHVQPHSDMPGERVVRRHMGHWIAVFAFDPQHRAKTIPVRLLMDDALRAVPMPAADADAHGVNEKLLARVRLHEGVAYTEETRRAYVHALRGDFPAWAAAQNPDIGRERFETSTERSARLDRARRQSDPCADAY